jgi:formamidopyrimidine-DNA glycosylase
MPELPEVETVRKGLAEAWTGQRIVSVEQRRPDLRFPFPPDLEARLEGATVRAVQRRAKHLVVHMDDGQVLLSHLGMSGRWTLHRASHGETLGVYHRTVNAPVAEKELGKHDHLVLRFEDGHVAVYTDPRRFGWIELHHGMDEVLRGMAHIGPEPLALEGTMDGAPQWSPQVLAQTLAGRRTPLKTALLDQRVVAGLGNIYVCEALHRAGLSPRRQSGTLVRGADQPTERLEALWTSCCDVLKEAIEAGGSTLSDFRGVEGELGYFPHSFRVYDREGQPCQGRDGVFCGQPVQRIVQSGRSTFFCSACQR